jgi:hypothetical protein
MQTPEERRALRRIKRDLVQEQYRVNPPPQKEVEKDNMETIHILMALALFIGLGLIITFATSTVITIWGITKIFAFVLAISLLIPIKWYRKKLTMNVYEFFLLSLLGYAPIITGLFFTLNFTTRSNYHVETYTIQSIEKGKYYSDVHLKNDTLSEYSLLTSYDTRESNFYLGRKTMRYEFEDGGFGLKILVDKRAIP